jgi:hypothetical protein
MYMYVSLIRIHSAEAGIFAPIAIGVTVTVTVVGPATPTVAQVASIVIIITIVLLNCWLSNGLRLWYQLLCLQG